MVIKNNLPILIRIFSFSILAITFVFLINNVLTIWFDWPGIKQLFSQYGLFGFKKLSKPLEESVLTFAFIQLFFYFISVLLVSNRVKLNWIFAVPLVAFSSKIILFFGAYGKFGNWIGGNYNWEGKIVSTIFTLVIILLIFRRNLKQVGLNLSQSGPAPRLGITIAGFTMIATITWNLFYFPGTKSEPISDMLYQAIMPSIEEELWFRGLLFAMLIKGLTTNDSKHPILYYGQIIQVYDRAKLL
mgnify:CR=1 FL=1